MRKYFILVSFEKLIFLMIMIMIKDMVLNSSVIHSRIQELVLIAIRGVEIKIKMVKLFFIRICKEFYLSLGYESISLIFSLLYFI